MPVGIILSTRLWGDLLRGVLNGSIYARQFAPQLFEGHLAAGCHVCQLVQGMELDQPFQEELPTEALLLTHEKIEEHWRLAGQKDLKKCYRCERLFPEKEYALCDLVDVCRYCRTMATAGQPQRKREA